MPTHPHFRLRTLLLWVAFVAVACAVTMHTNEVLIFALAIGWAVFLANAVLVVVILSGYFFRWVWERGRYRLRRRPVLNSRTLSVL